MHTECQAEPKDFIRALQGPPITFVTLVGAPSELPRSSHHPEGCLLATQDELLGLWFAKTQTRRKAALSSTQQKVISCFPLASPEHSMPGGHSLLL